MIKLCRGDRVVNGALILAINREKGFVLCYNNPKDEFIVWSVDEFGNTTSGDYFKSLEPAIEQFKTRTGVTDNV
jgi:hypothetical protein